MREGGRSWLDAFARRLGRLHWRLLAVNLVVLLVPVVGLEFAPVDVLELLAEIAERYENPDVNVRLVASGPVSPVQARREELGIALGNLVDNALRVTPSGGEVRLFVEAGEERSVVIAVEDDGPGVPPDYRARLFERFFTTDKEQGTGLGLPITRSVLEAVGGKVYLDAAPEPAVGTRAGGSARDGRAPTRFVVELPAAGRTAHGRTSDGR